MLASTRPTRRELSSRTTGNLPLIRRNGIYMYFRFQFRRRAIEGYGANFRGPFSRLRGHGRAINRLLSKCLFADLLSLVKILFFRFPRDFPIFHSRCFLLPFCILVSIAFSSSSHRKLRNKVSGPSIAKEGPEIRD